MEKKRVLKLIEKQPNEKVVEYLEDLLAKAKSGQIDSIIALFKFNDGEMGHMYSAVSKEEIFQYTGLLELTKITLVDSLSSIDGKK